MDFESFIRLPLHLVPMPGDGGRRSCRQRRLQKNVSRSGSDRTRSHRFLNTEYKIATHTHTVTHTHIHTVVEVQFKYYYIIQYI